MFSTVEVQKNNFCTVFYIFTPLAIKAGLTKLTCSTHAHQWFGKTLAAIAGTPLTTVKRVGRWVGNQGGQEPLHGALGKGWIAESPDPFLGFTELNFYPTTSPPGRT